MNNPLAFLLFIALFTGCIFREPAVHKFAYVNLKKADTLGRLNTNGVYYAVYPHEEHLVNYDSDIIKFGPDGVFCYMRYGMVDTIIEDIIPHIVDRLKEPKRMNYKGYYYVTGDTVKMEYLHGMPGNGYYWVYYDALINADKSLTLKQTSYKRYRIAMKSDGEGWKSNMKEPPRVLKFKPW